jgi:hypothetical protein
LQVADPERKQLSTVVLPASGEQALQAAAEAAAAHDMPFSGGEGAADASSSGSSTAAGSGNSSSAAAAGGGGGLLAAIARTVEEGGTHLKKLVGSALHGDHHHQQQQGEEEQQAEEFVDAEVPTESSESSGVKFEVQGADSAGAPGAPGTLCEGPSSSAAEEQQQQAAPGTDMHIGKQLSSVCSQWLIENFGLCKCLTAWITLPLQLRCFSEKAKQALQCSSCDCKAATELT